MEGHGTFSSSVGGVDLHTCLCYNILIHHIFRVGVMGTQGQTSHKTLKMKGRHTCQSIRLASSHQELLQVAVYIHL